MYKKLKKHSKNNLVLTLNICIRVNLIVYKCIKLNMILAEYDFSRNPLMSEEEVEIQY